MSTVSSQQQAIPKSATPSRRAPVKARVASSRVWELLTVAQQQSVTRSLIQTGQYLAQQQPGGSRDERLADD